MSANSAPSVPEGRYLVTGASGFVGRHLLRRLVDAGQPVVALDRPGAPPPLPFGLPAHRLVTPVFVELDRPRAVDACLAAERFDFVVHLAAKVGDWGLAADFERANVAGTRSALEAATRSGAKAVLHVSSIAAMGFAPGANAGRDTAPVGDPHDPYSRTKAEGEQVARELQSAGAPVVIVRPGDVFGPGSEPWVERPLRMLAKRQMLLVDGGRGHFAHVWIDNLLDGVLLALGTPAALGRTYVLTDAEQHTTMGAYFTRLAELAGLPPPRVALPRAFALGLARGLEASARAVGFVPPITRTAVRFVTKRCSYRIDEARAELGYEPRVSYEAALTLLGEHLSRRRG